MIRAAAVAAALLLAAPAGASTWNGAGADWSSDGDPGWNGTGVPNGVGAVANIPAGSGSGNDITVTGVSPTVGTIEQFGTGNVTRSISTGTITLNEDGAGAGHATISNIATNASNRLGFSSSITLTLADDLLISNTSASTGSYSIGASGKINGTGNLTIYNVSNSTSSGPISLSAANSFVGNVFIQKGSLNWTSTALGNSSNAITLGSSGDGSATMYSTGSLNSLAGGITVAGGTGGTLVIGSLHKGIYSGAVTLNGDLTVRADDVDTGTDYVEFSGGLSGVGGLDKIGVGRVILSAANAYAGGTTVSEGILSIGASSNLGGGALVIATDAVLDLDAAVAGTVQGTVDSLSLGGTPYTAPGTYGTTASGADYQDDTFFSGTGTVELVPEPATVGLLAIGGAVLRRRRRRS